MHSTRGESEKTMIDIKWWDGKFRAMTPGRRDLGVVQGVSTPEGPWVAGYGSTPEEALDDLYKAIGRHYVRTLTSDPPRGGAS